MNVISLISRWIADFVLFVGQQAQSFWENLTLLNYSPAQVFIDILLVSILFYYLFVLLKGSRAVNILIGLIVLAAIFAFSRILQLVTLGWLLDRFLTVILVAIPVIFQQELRMALERIGHTKIPISQKEKELNTVMNDLVSACEQMSRQKIGALIVLENAVPLKEYIDTGVQLNAKISQQLILSIFMNRSPLHDGAIIIKDNVLVAASCVLPHSYKSSPQNLGTRHKAARGLSEVTDAKIIVVSEEKGTISFAHSGQLDEAISLHRLHLFLNEFFKPRYSKKKRS